MLGDSAALLLAESSRSTTLRQLLPHNTNLVRQLHRECAALNTSLETGSELYSQLEGDTGYLASLTISALALRRNKRALLVYQQQRCEVIKDLFWAKGGSVTVLLGKEEGVRGNMTLSEVEFARSYGALITGLKSKYLDSIDLTSPPSLLPSGAAEPPTETHITVRVLKEGGEVELADGGRLTLSKGKQFFVRREGVEGLVLRGFLGVC